MAAAYQAGQLDAFGFTWPENCTRITDNMTAADSMKLQTSMTNYILQELKGTDGKAQDNDDKHNTDMPSSRAAPSDGRGGGVGCKAGQTLADPVLRGSAEGREPRLSLPQVTPK